MQALELFVCAECGSFIQEAPSPTSGRRRTLFVVETAEGRAEPKPVVHTKCLQCGDVKPWVSSCVRRSFVAPRVKPLPTAAETLADVTLEVRVDVGCLLCGANKDATPGHGILLDRVDDVSLARRLTCRTCMGQWQG